MKKTVQNLQALQTENKKFSVITAYDATQSQLAASAGIDAILVGDSLGMVVQGKDSTLPVTIDEMAYHSESVMRGISQSKIKPLVIADMPFMAYHNIDTALDNAATLMRTGCNMVKLEGGDWLAETVNQLVQNGIPVCAHLGLTPQSVNKFGGYKVQGKTETQQKVMLKDMAILEEAGASFTVLECIPSKLAEEATNATTMSTIGIGAGTKTDAQVLVCYDLLGLSPHPARFVKNFLVAENMHSDNMLEDAFAAYDKAVKNGSYPGPEHQYD